MVQQVHHNRDFIFDPSLVLYLPLWKRDGSSFISNDGYGRLCTVTGAVWTPQGHTFDGVDDDIVINTTGGLSMGAGDWSAMAWYKRIAAQTDYPVIVVFDGAGIALITSGQPGLLQGSDVVKGTTTSLTTGAWTCLGMTRRGTTYKCYFNGIDDTAIVTNPNWGLSGKYRLGKGYSDNVVKGVIGEVAVYNRLLTPQEIQQNYLATKWRYQ